MHSKMSANAFRSPLMQQIAAATRSHNRPPLVFSSSRLSAKNASLETNKASTKSTSPERQQIALTAAKNDVCVNSSRKAFSSATSLESLPPLSTRYITSIHQTAQASSATRGEEHQIEIDHSMLQLTIQSRRTTSNYMPIDISRVPMLKESMTRAVECAACAPNHHRTEPTTYYKIVTKTDACNRLIDICYNVALCRNLKKKTKEEAHINAQSKMQKWKDTIAGYIVVCVGHQPIQDHEYPYKSFTEDVDQDSPDEFSYWYDTIPIRPPQTERQLEDYASACASIQNMLLSLHSENWGSKWATGPIIRCRAMRSLIDCRENDAIAGIVMIGDPKATPREWNRRRKLDGDVMREL
jgi:nitroreductase